MPCEFQLAAFVWTFYNALYSFLLLSAVTRGSDKNLHPQVLFIL